MELITSSGCAESERVSTLNILVSELLTRFCEVRLFSSLRPGEGGLDLDIPSVQIDSRGLILRKVSRSDFLEFLLLQLSPG